MTQQQSKPQARGQEDAQRQLDERLKRVEKITTRLIDEVAKVIVGKRHVLEHVTTAILTQGAHVLFEDMPGLGKSVMCEAFADAAGADFRRIQFTPDLLPGDITGSSIYNEDKAEFTFQPGPLFTNFLLADEINRASPKTQSAMLESMAEKQVSVEGTTYDLDPPFFVMATQNPVEQEGTYPLPEAQMDRFAMKLSMGYPSLGDEVEILERRIRRRTDNHSVDPVCNPNIINAMQETTEYVHTGDEMLQYICGIVDATRKHDDLKAGASPRGSLNLLKLSRAWAAMNGRSYVTPDDVKRLAKPVLAHRLILEPEAKLADITERDALDDVLDDVPVPKI